MKNKQLVYEPRDEQTIRVSLEDISVIVLENNISNVTTALLSEISEKNIVEGLFEKWKAKQAEDADNNSKNS
jgi:CRISPR/Cas system-associated endonuclease Cas1